MSTNRRESPFLGEVNDALPLFLSKMTIATPPQITFDKADQFLLEANDLRAKAAALSFECKLMKDRANHLQATAFDLQRLATQDRLRIQDIFNNVLETYEHILGTFHISSKLGKTFEDLKLAVEDGTALAEDVSNMEVKLKAQAERLDALQLVVQNSYPETDDEMVTIDLNEIQQTSRKRALSPVTSEDSSSQQPSWYRKPGVKRAKHDFDSTRASANRDTVKAESSNDADIEIQDATGETEEQVIEETGSDGGDTDATSVQRYEDANMVIITRGDKTAILDKSCLNLKQSLYTKPNWNSTSQSKIYEANRSRDSSIEEQTSEKGGMDVTETQAVNDVPDKSPDKKRTRRARRVRATGAGKTGTTKVERKSLRGDKIRMEADDLNSDLD